jgi:hypothetical protein
VAPQENALQNQHAMALENRYCAVAIPANLSIRINVFQIRREIAVYR